MIRGIRAVKRREFWEHRYWQTAAHVTGAAALILACATIPLLGGHS